MIKEPALWSALFVFTYCYLSPICILSTCMKAKFILLFVLFQVICQSAISQPEGINYQAVAKDRMGKAVSNKTIRVRTSIVPESAEQEPVYSELHSTKANELGLFNIVIGQGTAVTGLFSDISWGANKFFLRIELDPEGGYDFLPLGAFQFLSVPYALYAKQAEGFTFDNKLSPQKKEGISFSFSGGKSTSKEYYRGISSKVSGTGLNGANAAIFGEFRAQPGDADPIRSEGFGVHGSASGGVYNCGVFGETNGTGDVNYGTYGYSNGRSKNGNYGVFGHAVFSMGNNYGVFGKAISRTVGNNYGVYGIARGGAENYAGYFDGKAKITQALTIGDAQADSFASFAMGKGAQVLSKYAIAMGDAVVASGYCSFATGTRTEAKGNNSFAGGEDCASNYSNSLVYGQKCYTYGSNAIALGYSTLAKTASFAFSDASSEELLEAEENTFTVRASKGVFLYSSGDLHSGVSLAPGAGAWATLSDRSKKENFKSLDAEDVLQQICSLPVTRWNYKTQSKDVLHIGPMAQDFYKAFRLGGIGNDTTITTSDMDGITLLGIQALEKRSQAQTLVLKALKEENEQLKARLDAIEKALVKTEVGSTATTVSNR